ncbi:MAG TPA: hypothetical protein VD788_05885, partial [Candidatus Polarisedimenticolaceae bacterium]|nr:hypothetical protein [Candidatus Polarisedimenticolaceae bacterium]
MHDSKGLAAPIDPPRGSKSLQVGLLALGCAALALAVPFLGNPWLYALAALLLACFLLPVWNDLQLGRLDPFETIHVMGLRYFAFFGLGAVWTFQNPGDVAYDKYIPPYLLPATFYCVIGYFALLFAYYAPPFRRDAAPAVEERPNGIVFTLIPGAIGLLGSMAAALWNWAAWAGIALSGAVSALGQLTPLYHFAWALCWLLVFSRSTSRPQRLALLAFFLPASVLIVASTLTDKSLAMTIAGTPLAALWYARGKLPWKTLCALLLVLIFVIFPFFNTFRLFDPRIPLSNRIEMTTRVIRTWDLEAYLAQSATAVQRRLALINSVAVVVRDTPRWVPYAEGSTLFLPAIAYFIPRAIWPDKPRFTLGREFGETFRVIHILDEKSSIAATVPGELYWNFDFPGIVVGMAVWGAAMRFFYVRYGQAHGQDPVRRAIHILLLIQFVHFGGGLAAQSVLLLRTLILL